MRVERLLAVVRLVQSRCYLTVGLAFHSESYWLTPCHFTMIQFNFNFLCVLTISKIERGDVRSSEERSYIGDTTSSHRV